MLIFSVFLIGFCLSLTKISHWKIEVTPFFVISALVVLLYGFAYFNVLLVGTWFLSGLGFFATLYGTFLLYSERNQIFEKYLTPGFVLALLLLIVMCSYSFFSLPSIWDEFTHWGPHNILLHYNNGLPNANDVLIHQSYPPAGELFHYFFVFNGPFVISNVYAAQTILIIAPLFVLFQRFTWSQWPLVFFLLLFIFSLLSILHADIGPGKTLYMDSCVGIYWGSLVAYFILSDKKTSDILYLLPIIACFMLLKLNLMPLVLISTSLISISSFFAGEGPLPARDWQTGIARATTLSRPYLLLLVPLVAWLMLKSWLHYLHISRIPLEWNSHPGMKIIMENFLDPQFYQAKKLIFSHFAFRSLRNLIMPCILFLAPLALVAFSREKNRAEIIFIQIFAFLGYSIFLFGLLFLYLYTFTNYEAGILASYERYVMIYLVGWAIIDLAQFSQFLVLKKVEAKKWLSIAALGTIPFFLLTIHCVYKKKARALNSEQGLWSLQREIAKISEQVNKLTPLDAKIATIWQASAGLERAIIVYQLTPRRPNLDCNSYGDAYGPEDVWTCKVSQAQFLKNMTRMDYLLLAYSDNNFWSKYGALFPKQKIPLATYQFCLTGVFNVESHEHCALHSGQAYLYKIVKANHQIHFQLIPPIRS